MNLDRAFRRAMRDGFRGINQSPRTPTPKAARPKSAATPTPPLAEPVRLLGHPPRPRKRR